MKNLIHFLLKYSWIILEFKDDKGVKQHKLNLWNPISYVAMVCTGLVIGITALLKTFFNFVTSTIKSSI